MWLKIPSPKIAISFVAGLIGLAFDQLTNLEATATDPVRSDDLTKISGIGRAFAGRLKAAGVNSYADLAAMSPEEVRDITRVAEWQGDPAEWIAEAQGLI